MSWNLRVQNNYRFEIFKIEFWPHPLSSYVRCNENYQHEYEQPISKIGKDTYIDDLVTAYDTLDKVKNLKEISTVLFQKVLLLFSILK